MNEETKTQAELSQEPNPKQSVGAFVWDLFKILIIALLIIVPFRAFIAEPFVVSGSSMLPNYHNRDYLIIDRFSYRNGSPQRGDVVVLKFPKDPSQYYIKRIIGLPGERVSFDQGRVVVFNQANPNGLKLSEPYLQNSSETFGKNQEAVLGEGQYFVLGDNRTASSDSRVWGILPKEDIVGKVWLRVFPVKDFGLFQEPVYN
jgi:signal peptidase I